MDFLFAEIRAIRGLNMWPGRKRESRESARMKKGGEDLSVVGCLLSVIVKTSQGTERKFY